MQPVPTTAFFSSFHLAKRCTRGSSDNNNNDNSNDISDHANVSRGATATKVIAAYNHQMGQSIASENTLALSLGGFMANPLAS